MYNVPLAARMFVEIGITRSAVTRPQLYALEMCWYKVLLAARTLVEICITRSAATRLRLFASSGNSSATIYHRASASRCLFVLATGRPLATAAVFTPEPAPNRKAEVEIPLRKALVNLRSYWCLRYGATVLQTF